MADGVNKIPHKSTQNTITSAARTSRTRRMGRTRDDKHNQGDEDEDDK